MHVERQGLDECGLATIAALAGIPLDTVRAKGCEYADAITWSCICGEFHDLPRFWRAFYNTAKFFGGESLAFLVVARKDLRLLGVIVTGSPTELPRDIETLPGVGRGAITIDKTFGRGHIAPWENGLVYDPNDSGNPKTLAEFLQDGWTVRRITIE